MLTHISLIYRTIKNFSRFAYNTRIELIEAHLGTKHYVYSYDNIGNRKTAQELAEESTYEANQLNQYTDITQSETPFTPTFDADGNQTLIKTTTGIWSAVYNADNRPTSFSQAQGDQSTIIECDYDYTGRRYMKKVTSNGVLSLHQRYIYRGYLQIACVDLTRSGHPALWYITWDPTEPVATRPLAIQKNATWYSYSHDLTKNVTELYQSDGLIATSYDYSPYGAATAEGTDQPLQWSSEYHDPELALTYYNYRHYNPTDGRWINRDPLGEEEGGLNLYWFTKAYLLYAVDYLGGKPIVVTKATSGSGSIIDLPAIDSACHLPLTINIDLENEKIERKINKALNKLWKKITLSYVGKKACDWTTDLIVSKLNDGMKNSNFMDHNQAEIRMKMGDLSSAINYAQQEMLGIAKDPPSPAKMSLSLEAELSIPLCEVVNQNLGVKLTNSTIWTEKSPLMSPDNKFRGKARKVDQYEAAINLGVTLPKLKLGSVSVEVNVSGSLSFPELKKIKPSVRVQLGVQRQF